MSFGLSHGKTMDVGDVGIDQSQLPPYEHGPIDLKGWFGAEGAGKPMELEIGSGKGTFLVQHAALLPGVNFIGIEYARQFWRYASDRVRRHGLKNVKLVHTEAGAFVRNFVPNGSLRRVHIYFPDPWPKKRHHKRRLVQESFLRQLHAKLEADAEVRLATDHADYFQWMLDHAARAADLYATEPFERPAGAGEGELVGTNFERKYRREGRPFNAVVLRKRV